MRANQPIYQWSWLTVDLWSLLTVDSVFQIDRMRRLSFFMSYYRVFAVKCRPIGFWTSSLLFCWYAIKLGI